MPVAFRAKPCVVAGDRREAVVEECVNLRSVSNITPSFQLLP